jgi:transposase
MTHISKSSPSGSPPASSIESAIPDNCDLDPEVVEVATRRQFSASEKRILLAEADRCKQRGELGAFLRRNRIYSSMLHNWRKQLEGADRTALAPKKRGPKRDASAGQVKHLNRDIARLRQKLERAELIIDAQKKLCVALGLPTADEPSGDE